MDERGSQRPSRCAISPRRAPPRRRRRRRADEGARRRARRRAGREGQAHARGRARARGRVVMGRWRGDALRMGERAGSTLCGVFRELGLVTRREYEELELRLAQLEHRLRLVERQPRHPPPASASVSTPPPPNGRCRPAVRQLGRISEIAQVAAKHGFGYFFDTPAGRPLARQHELDRRGRGVDPRPARPPDARRARADLRQVRAAPLDAPRRRPAGHRLRAARRSRTTSRRSPSKRRRACHPRGARPQRRAALPRVRARARSRPPRSARCTGGPSERPPRRRQGAAAGRARADRGRPRAHVPGRAPRPRAR